MYIICGDVPALQNPELNAGAEHLGQPANGALVRTLNMTNNAMARTAAFLHHLPFAADELQQVEQQWTDTNALIMQLTEGMDRSRAKARGGIEALTTWRNTFLFTVNSLSPISVPATAFATGAGSRSHRQAV